LTPIFDVIEFFFYLIFSVVIFLNQDTWLVQFSIMIFANALSCIVKLIGSFALLRAEVPDPKTFEFPVWSYNCYFYSRMAGLTINIMGFIAQAVISALAINNTNYYNEPRYGLCAFCYKLDACQTSYREFIIGLDYAAKEKGMVLSASSVISFN